MYDPIIILAAGKSERTGTPKPLIEIDGVPWIQKQWQDLLRFQNPYVVFVLGFHAENILAKVPELKSHCAFNETPEKGQFSSLQAGLRPLFARDWECCYVLPVDVPVPQKSVWDNLKAEFRKGIDAVIPTVKSQGGHPVLLSRELCAKILSVDPDKETARLDFVLRESKNIKHVEVDDGRVLENRNTDSEYKKREPS